MMRSVLLLVLSLMHLLRIHKGFGNAWSFGRPAVAGRVTGIELFGKFILFLVATCVMFDCVIIS